MPKAIRKAGAIITRSGLRGPEVLLLYRGEHGDWSFPKGHCEKGETNEETMYREVLEETGLWVRIVSPLPTFKYVSKSGGPCSVAMFHTELSGGEIVLENPDDRLEWVAAEKVVEALTGEASKRYFQAVQTDLKA